MTAPERTDLAWVAAAPAHREIAPAFVLRTLGRTDYERCWRAMQAWTAARHGDTVDELWITEHPPVYTLGLAG